MTFNKADILLPKNSVDMSKWSVVACDQYTSEPEYWNKVESFIGSQPSTYNLILPEIYLEDDNVESKWKIICNNEVISDGVAVAFFYTDNEIVTTFTGEYKETENMGIITEVKNNRTLVSIDGVSSLKKYAHWINESPSNLLGKDLLITSITKPLGIKNPFGDMTVIRHPMFGNDNNTRTLSDDTMLLDNNIIEKTAIIQMETTTDDLVNSTGNTMKKLKEKCPNASGYLLIHCGGRRLGIGNRMNEVYEQIKKEAEDVPFLVIFTFGEYGYTEDAQTNATGGLMLSFTAFEK